MDFLAAKLGISKVLSAILLQRGFEKITDAERFIAPKISNLNDPFLLKNMDHAIALLDRYVQRKSSVSIIGDYDVDGITSTALLVDILRRFGIWPQYFVPRRFSEGYGMSKEIVRRMLKKSRPGLVIALDCGTNSVDEIRFLVNKGIDVLVIDHHTLTVNQAPPGIIINPHLSEHSVSLKSMCAVGLVFKFVHAFLKHRRKQGDERAFAIRLKSYFDIVALGTIADMMPVLHENRIIVKYGLQSFAKERRPGLDALCAVANIPSGQAITQADVSFKLAPRINVSGRLFDALLPVELLLADDISGAMVKAQKIDRMNRERQRIEQAVVLEAKKMVQEHYRDDPGIVLFNPDWHSGVVGIVAGKLAKEYGRPAIVLSLERGVAKGSGRSSSVNLFDVLAECSAYLEDWGGHKMAVGVALKPGDIDIFRNTFNRVILQLCSEIRTGDEEIEIAYVLDRDDIDEFFVNELEDYLHPYGQQNEEPIFCLKNIRFTDTTEFFGIDRKHVRFWIERKDRPWLSGIGWDMASHFPERNRDVDILVCIAFDFWNNERFLLLRLVDWRYSL
ncbi:MAG: single-stranded-DNA-specific exonuclease RecJ [Puniceicoccales bacterium]|jgi:single-stranded-DNA-specific exonuclease|nr:single-stranded-DNA-specific exonuclease RecJ [Puniceicoccales bacterium]